MGAGTFSMIICLFEYNLAYSTVIIPYFGLTKFEASWFASISCFFVCFFAPIGGKVTDIFGKKIMVMILTPILATGWILMAVSESTMVLFIGCILTSSAVATMLPLPSKYTLKINFEYGYGGFVIL